MDVKERTKVVLSPRTVLNGGERGHEHVRETKKQRRRLTIRELGGEKQSHASINGGELDLEDT